MRKNIVTALLSLFVAFGAGSKAFAIGPDLSSAGYLYIPATSVAPGATFDNSFSFVLSSPGTDFLATISNIAPFVGNPGYGFTSFAAQIVRASDTASALFTSSNSGQQLDFGPGPMQIDQYDIRIIGTAGALGGAYAGSLSIAGAVVTPVPEPLTSAMFIAGIGLILTIAGRRRGAV